MTFTIKVRGSAGLIACEYLCPVHGRFDVTSTNPPDVMRCTIDDVCHGCGGQPAPMQGPFGCLVCEGKASPCLAPSPWVISAPKPRVLSVPAYAAVRGGDTERRPGMLDTRKLAEGQPYAEWRQERAKEQQARRHDQLIAKGLKQRKVIV